MNFSKITFFGIIGLVALVGCNSGDGESTPPGGDPGPVDIQATWSVTGTIEFPAGETASNLKLIATRDIVDFSGDKILSDAVPLALTGSPPMANFQLNIDASTLQLTSRSALELFVFQDIDDDGINDNGEALRSLSPTDSSCAVWGNGANFSSRAFFWYRTAGSTNTPVTGWYYPSCNPDNACLTLITDSNQSLMGAKISYALIDETPIQP